MDKILLFAGTTEGRNLAEFLEKNQIPTEVCVATQYGETLLEEGKYLHVHAGRLDETEMEQQIQKQQIRFFPENPSMAHSDTASGVESTLATTRS